MADSFTDYCAAVCALVRFKPDREAIAGELTAHMEDHMAALEAEGAPREEAKARAIEAMGDPEALGKALDALHSPLLGWLQLWMWRLSRLAAVISISLSLLLAVGPVRSGWAGLWDVFDREEVLAGGGEVVAELRPKASCRAGGYTVALPRAWVVRQEDGELWVYFLLRAGHLDPWIQRPDFGAALSARDDLGGAYRSQPDAVTGASEGPAGEVAAYRSTSTPFFTCYEGRIYPVDPAAERIVLTCAPYGETVFSLSFSLEEVETDG